MGVVPSSLLERGKYGGHNLDSEHRNQAFASSYSYLRVGFPRFQAFGNLGLTVDVPPPMLAFRQPEVRVHRQWR